MPMRHESLILALSPLAFVAASCDAAPVGDKAATETAGGEQFELRWKDVGTFDQPWAIEVDPGTGTVFVTEKAGTIKFVQPNGRLGTVTGVPEVAYGGQGGLGDFVFAPGENRSTLDQRTVYLSWAEAGEGDTRGAVVGRANMVCEEHDSCELRDLKVIWRQVPKVTGQGHYSHRIAVSPDGEHLFIASGDRQKLEPAQDLANNLGTVVRLNPDGTAAAGNPFAGRNDSAADNPVTDQIWSYGHRNILGLQFDAQGRLWALEHGPRGGDELNLIEPGKNYGWPVVSDGIHYRGEAIPDHSTRPDLAAPAIGWTPVIAPGGFTFVSGDRYPGWEGRALIAGMVYQGLVEVAIEGERGREVARHPLGSRIRDIEQGPDGTIWIVEDARNNPNPKLRRLIPPE
jgi:aldose sugar dehydrogenase